MEKGRRASTLIGEYRPFPLVSKGKKRGGALMDGRDVSSYLDLKKG